MESLLHFSKECLSLLTTVTFLLADQQLKASIEKRSSLLGLSLDAFADDDRVQSKVCLVLVERINETCINQMYSALLAVLHLPRRDGYSKRSIPHSPSGLLSLASRKLTVSLMPAVSSSFGSMSIRSPSLCPSSYVFMKGSLRSVTR